MSVSLKQFELVGYRFRNLTIDETLFDSDSGTVKIAVAVASGEPQLSAQKMKGRPVIELSISVGVNLVDESAEASTSAKQAQFIKAECTAGFVGTDLKDDGQISLFGECKDQVARSMYWLVRQRIVSLLTMTKFRAVQLPWDVVGSDAKPSTNPRTKSVRRSAKTTKKKTGK